MATLAVPGSPGARPRQNWILSSWGDYLFIIGTPVFVLPIILGLFFYGGELLVWSAFAVVNTSHHLPTFMRIYGDRDLLNRFRWSLLLAPIIPFSCCLVAVSFLIYSGSSLNNILYLYVIVTIWDLWHFLMQHYGFMRIYDRHNRAPGKIAARMDLWFCTSWFIFVMLATLAWLPTLLYQLEIDCGLPLLSFVDSSVQDGCWYVALGVALLMTICYIFYLSWCWQKNYFISYAKLALMLVTFGMMALTYVPHGAMDLLIAWITGTFNALVGGFATGQGSGGLYARGFSPSGGEWTLLSGFATLGIVHVTQYLAIVWKYNRNLAQRDQGVRTGIFQKFFSRGGGPVISIYVLLCLVYGYVVTMGPGNPVQPNIRYDWLAGLLVSVLFASTITHYYYDGFIWKVRHKENRQNLEMEEAVEPATGKTVSWWDRSGTLSPLKALCWHAVYFLPPILFLSGCYWMAQQRSIQNPVEEAHQLLQEVETSSTLSSLTPVLISRIPLAAMGPSFTPSVSTVIVAVENSGAGQPTADQQQRARDIIEKLDHQLIVEQRMIELYPLKKHYTYAAELMYYRLKTKVNLTQQGTDDLQALNQYHREFLRAISRYEKSLKDTVRGSFVHREFEKLFVGDKKPDDEKQKSPEGIVKQRLDVFINSANKLGNDIEKVEKAGFGSLQSIR